MIIERYILRNARGPFLFSVSIITFVFVMDFIIRTIDLFLEKGVGPGVVAQVFVLSLAHMFALIIPMAVLPATLMTFGNLAAENEITAMKACGVSLYRIMAPCLVASAVLAGALVVFNNHTLPEANHRLVNLYYDINRKKPTVELRENRLITDLPGYTMYFRDKDDRTGRVSEVQIFRHDQRGLPTSIVARRGRMTYIDSLHVLRVVLHDGEIHELPAGRDRRQYRITRFRQYTLHIRDVDRSLQRTRREYRGDREMSAAMMRRKIDEIRADIEIARRRMATVARERVLHTMRLLDPRERRRRFGSPDSLAAAGGAAGRRPRALRAITRSGGARGTPVRARSEFLTRQEIETQVNRIESYRRQIDRYKVEIHKKYSIPVACVVFVLIGVPLAIRAGRGMSVATGWSMAVFTVYYVCLIGGEKLADRALLAPWLSMWAPDLLFGAMGVVLTRSTAREQHVGSARPSEILRMLRRHRAPANPR